MMRSLVIFSGGGYDDAAGKEIKNSVAEVMRATEVMEL